MDSFKAKMPADEANVLDETVPVEKAQIEAKEKNAKVMQVLIGAMMETEDMNKIMTKQRQDMKYPTWLSCMVWAVLKREYTPSDSAAQVDMELALLKINLTKKMNLMWLLNKKAAIECHFNLNVTDNRRRAIMLTAAGKEYSLIPCWRGRPWQRSCAMKWNQPGGLLEDLLMTVTNEGTETVGEVKEVQEVQEEKVQGK